MKIELTKINVLSAPLNSAIETTWKPFQRVACVALIQLGITTTLYKHPTLTATVSLALFLGLLAYCLDRQPKNITPSLPEITSCSALPTKHGVDTKEWRKELVAAAEHNIIASASYCGGNTFIDFLDDIEKRIQERPKLKVVVISSSKFIFGKTLEKVNSISKNYPDNFSLVKTPAIWRLATPAYWRITNHTKCLVIDYGKYFLMGGSGIKDNFAKTGLETKRRSTIEEPYDFVESMLPESFRDMDFVFKSHKQNPAGHQVYRQLLLLSQEWEMLTQKSAESKSESLTAQLLKSDIQHVKSKILRFNDHPCKAEKIAFQLFSTGLTNAENSFPHQIVEYVHGAKEKIIVNHMYFHPPSALMEAFIGAANRGVQITIITNGVHPSCPGSHRVFAPRNKYNYTYLARSVTKEAQQNIQVYEYRQGNKGLHKKVMLIDDRVIAGSSNIGYKSLVTCADHELNFSAVSAAFAAQTLNICMVDISRSIKIEDPTQIDFSDYLKATIHRILAPIIG